MTDRWTRVRSSVRNGFWAIPAACVTGALLLAHGLVSLDRSLTDRVAYAFGAGPDGAREVLSAITTAMITFTGLVFSITIVVLQLTSSQFSPRVLRTFLRDRLTQLSLGVFVATFVYAVMVLRTVDSGEETEFVPGGRDHRRAGAAAAERGGVRRLHPPHRHDDPGLLDHRLDRRRGAQDARAALPVGDRRTARRRSRPAARRPAVGGRARDPVRAW